MEKYIAGADRTFTFYEKDAQAYGMQAAVILYNIRYWTHFNEQRGVHFHDGRYWTYNSVAAFSGLYTCLTEPQIKRAIKRLIDDGAVLVANYNKSAYDRTRWYTLNTPVMPSAHLTNPPSAFSGQLTQSTISYNGQGDIVPPIPDVNTENSLSVKNNGRCGLNKERKKAGTPGSKGAKAAGSKASQTNTTNEGGSGGFGMIEPSQTDTTEYGRLAARLAEAVKSLPPRRTGHGRTRPGTWATHIKKLHTTDKIPMARITKVLAWYTAHIGQEFMPEAFSGPAFRKKFAAIERQYEKNIVDTLEITPQAATVAGRLACLGWPAGSAENLPGAVAAGLVAYRNWRKRLRVFVDKLKRDDLVEDYGNKRNRYFMLAESIYQRLAAPDHFIQEWMRAVHGRIVNWPEFSGCLKPYIFNEDAKQFRTLGRGLAAMHNDNPDTWDRLMKIMQQEMMNESE